MLASRQLHALSSSAGLLFSAGACVPAAAWGLLGANARPSCSSSTSSSSAACDNGSHQQLAGSITHRAACCHDMHVSSAGMLSRSSAHGLSSMHGGVAAPLAGMFVRQALPHLQQQQRQQPQLSSNLPCAAASTGVWQCVRHASSSRGSRAPSPPCLPLTGAAAAAASAPASLPGQASMVQSLHSSAPAAEEVAQHQFQSYDASTDMSPLLACLQHQQSMVGTQAPENVYGREGQGGMAGHSPDTSTTTSYAYGGQVQQQAAAASGTPPDVGGMERYLALLQRQAGLEGSNTSQHLDAAGSSSSSSGGSWMFRSSSHLKAPKPKPSRKAAAASYSRNVVDVATSSSSSNQQKLQALLQQLEAQRSALEQEAGPHSFLTSSSSSSSSSSGDLGSRRARAASMTRARMLLDQHHAAASSGGPSHSPQVSSVKSLLASLQQLSSPAGATVSKQQGVTAAAARGKAVQPELAAAAMPLPLDMLSELATAVKQRQKQLQKEEAVGAAAMGAGVPDGSGQLSDVLVTPASRDLHEPLIHEQAIPEGASTSAGATAAAADPPPVAAAAAAAPAAAAEQLSARVGDLTQQQQQQQQQPPAPPAPAAEAEAGHDQQQQLLTQLLKGLSSGTAPSSSAWNQLDWQPDHLESAAVQVGPQQQQQQQQGGTVTLQHLLSKLGTSKQAASSTVGEQVTALPQSQGVVEGVGGEAEEAKSAPSAMLDGLAAALEQQQQQQYTDVGGAADAAFTPPGGRISDVVASLGAKGTSASGGSNQHEAADTAAAAQREVGAMPGGAPQALPLNILDQSSAWPQQEQVLDVAAVAAAGGQLSDVMATLKQHSNSSQQQQQQQEEEVASSTAAPAQQQQQQQQQQQEGVPLSAAAPQQQQQQQQAVTADDQRVQLQQLLQGLSQGKAPSSSLLAQQQQRPRQASIPRQQVPATLQDVLARQAARGTAASSAAGVELAELLQERAVGDTSQFSNVLQQLSVELAGAAAPGADTISNMAGSPLGSLSEMLDRARGPSHGVAPAAAAAAGAGAAEPGMSMDVVTSHLPPQLQQQAAPQGLSEASLVQQAAQERQALQQSLAVLQKQLQDAHGAAATGGPPAAGAAGSGASGLQGLISNMASRVAPMRSSSSDPQLNKSSSSGSAVDDLFAALAGKAPSRTGSKANPPPTAAAAAEQGASAQLQRPIAQQPAPAAGVQQAMQQQQQQQQEKKKVEAAVQPPVKSAQQAEQEALAAAAAATEDQMQNLFKQLAKQDRAAKFAAKQARLEATGLTDLDQELSDPEFDQESGRRTAAKKSKGKGSKAAAAGAALAQAAAASSKKKAKGGAAAAAATSAADRWAAKLAALQQQQEGGGRDAPAATHSLKTSEPKSSSAAAAAAAAAPGATGGSSMREVSMPAECTVLQLAGLLDMSAERLEEVLTSLGEPVRSAEDLVSPDVAELAALEVGVVLLVPEPSLGSAAARQPRPPVVTVMGHVDHGKTSLLDALRSSNVAAGEAGGITQHIGAFQVELPGSGASITFLDTPGHAAFGAMRARGAAVTDIVVLAVAADDGVMPQTREALAHARAANCPVVVAMTKCDLPQADPERVKRQLLAESVELEEYGGDVQVVETAATAGQGLAELEEALLLQAEVMELAAPSSGAAQGLVVEAQMERGRGAVATVIIKAGNLSVGDPLVVGTEYGKVRALRDSRGQPLTSVGPGQHAVVSGLKGLPAAGDEVQVVATEDRAARISRARSSRAVEYRQAQLARSQRAAAAKQREAHQQEQERRKRLKERLLQLQREGKHREGRQLFRAHQAATAASATTNGSSSSSAGSLPGAAGAPAGSEAAAAEAGGVKPAPDAQIVDYIIKADVQGSVEAVRDAIAALATERVVPRVVYAAAGPITTSDIHLAAATGAHLVAFNLKPPAADIEASLKQSSVEVMSHQVIYHLLDAVGRHMEAASGGPGGAGGREVVVGSATVLQLFPLLKKGKEVGQVVGCRVLDGSLSMEGRNVYRLVREGEVVWEGSCSSLRRQKEDVASVEKAQECGVVLGEGDSSVKVEPGDVLQCVARPVA